MKGKGSIAGATGFFFFVGPVTIDMERSRGDFTGYTVPGDCIGFVMGRNGQTLRSMEEEWGVLMFFAKTEGSQRGPRRGVERRFNRARTPSS